MHEIQWVHREEDARVLVVSQRNRLPIAPRCMNYELESVIAQIDRADVVSFGRSLNPGRWRRRLIHRLGPLGMIGCDRSPRVDRQYELLFCSLQSVRDLKHFGPMERWLRCARHSMCMIDEVWNARIDPGTYEFYALSHFDIIVSGCRQSVERLREVTGKTVQYLPPGIDAITFCPYPNPPQRCIDVYSMGRRSPETHAALLAYAQENNRFYMYDTFSQYGVKDITEHRRMLSDFIKRSRFFIANRAKVDSGDQTHDQEEIGFRFFEGAAGGAVMIGEAPRSSDFKEFFGWEDAVLDLPFGSSNVAEVIEAAESQPGRLERASRRNMENSLLRHDWLYRWCHLMNLLDLPSPERAEARRTQLTQLANQVATQARAAA